MKEKKIMILAIFILLLLELNNCATTSKEPAKVTKSAKEVYLEYREKLDKCKREHDKKKKDA